MRLINWVVIGIPQRLGIISPFEVFSSKDLSDLGRYRLPTGQNCQSVHQHQSEHPQLFLCRHSLLWYVSALKLDFTVENALKESQLFQNYYLLWSDYIISGLPRCSVSQLCSVQLLWTHFSVKALTLMSTPSLACLIYFQLLQLLTSLF